MITDNAEQDQFISEHRWAVLTTLRRDGQPVSSMVAYAREADSLLISTPGATFKRRSLDRDARATLCILSNSEPFNFVSVEGRASIEIDNLAPGTRLVFANIAEAGYAEPENLEDWLDSQQRVLIHLHPERVSGVIR